jgi:hypothetical protein
MLPILLHVAHIVDEVNGGAHQAERNEGQCSTSDHGWLKEPASGQRCGEDEEVLDPLAGSRSAESGWHPAAANGNLCGLGHQDATLSIPVDRHSDKLFGRSDAFVACVLPHTQTRSTLLELRPC